MNLRRPGTAKNLELLPYTLSESPLAFAQNIRERLVFRWLRIIIFAKGFGYSLSPECCKDPNLYLYKGYFNIAWFVRAYSALLFGDYDEVITTYETKEAIRRVKPEVDEELNTIWGCKDEFVEEWRVPSELDESRITSIGAGFDAQVELAARVAEGKVERLLMFQDPDDVQTHLPEAYALIRNCAIADVGLNINAGATFWAETQWVKKQIQLDDERLKEFGLWRTSHAEDFRKMLNPAEHRVAFIAHDKQKPKMSRLIYHYREQLVSEHLSLTGTSGTCHHAKEYLGDRISHWEVPKLVAAGTKEDAGHGPTGGDVVIASEIIHEWTSDAEKVSMAWPGLKTKLVVKKAHKTKTPVRIKGLTHAVVFFIDHKHAQPHEADIHVLLRTCLHPSHGVHILLNERTAREWGDNLRRTGGEGGIK